jgi:hypothetical protein
MGIEDPTQNNFSGEIVKLLEEFLSQKAITQSTQTLPVHPKS